ncbi:phosphotransferase family protein [Curtobacterium ammoniigenes]|uniref:phosphotransferase family protein n=1 Tax=Curtobacterium ammoniigenes TaxID=395387 RepID=UPI00082A8A3C|nr:phosphotransferase [Curtobacterium ammoniigenes]
MTETRYAAPDADAVNELVNAALRSVGSTVPSERWERVAHGSANLVILADDVAVRVSRTSAAAAQSVRAQQLVDALPDLPFAVPRSLASPSRNGHLVAIPQRRAPGAPHAPGSGEPARLVELLDALTSVALPDIEQHLAEPHAYMGGADWYTVMVAHAIPLLATPARSTARNAADALAELDTVSPALTHGDLAGANVLWNGPHVSAVIDWDLASAGDPAEDVAALATWHGWTELERRLPSQVLERARVIAATFPIQVICFAIVNQRPAEELQRAVQRAEARLIG